MELLHHFFQAASFRVGDDLQKLELAQSHLKPSLSRLSEDA
jgi:hypothetical protein